MERGKQRKIQSFAVVSTLSPQQYRFASFANCRVGLSYGPSHKYITYYKSENGFNRLLFENLGQVAKVRVPPVSSHVTSCFHRLLGTNWCKAMSIADTCAEI